MFAYEEDEKAPVRAERVYKERKSKGPVEVVNVSYRIRELRVPANKKDDLLAALNAIDDTEYEYNGRDKKPRKVGFKELEPAIRNMGLFDEGQCRTRVSPKTGDFVIAGKYNGAFAFAVVCG